MLRILIVCDHPFIRRGMRETLIAEIAPCEVREEADGLAAFSQLTGTAFDIAIIDILLPGKNGLDLVKDVRAVRPQTRFLVANSQRGSDFADRAYRNGAAGYMDRCGSADDLLIAVRKILAGRKYVSSEYAELLMDGRRGSDGDSLLSDRELSVLRLYAEGKRLLMIGAELNLSVKTVSTYKHRAMRKLKLTNNPALIAYAIDKGWTPGRL